MPLLRECNASGALHDDALSGGAACRTMHAASNKPAPPQPRSLACPHPHRCAMDAVNISPVPRACVRAAEVV